MACLCDIWSCPTFSASWSWVHGLSWPHPMYSIPAFEIVGFRFYILRRAVFSPSRNVLWNFFLSFAAETSSPHFFHLDLHCGMTCPSVYGSRSLLLCEDGVHVSTSHLPCCLEVISERRRKKCQLYVTLVMLGVDCLSRYYCKSVAGKWVRVKGGPARCQEGLSL